MEAAGDYVQRNRSAWNREAADHVETGERNWAAAEPSWGRWSVPEAQLHVLPERLEGLDCIELGCGTAYVSAWLARRGARPVGIDVSEQQLATAARLQAEHELSFPLLHGNAEQVPLADASFDVAISEYGASIWCDPYRWIPEASRLLRPGGQLIFLVNSVIAMLCEPEDETVQPTNQMLRAYFGMHRFEWPEDESVEFHLPHGELIALLRANDLTVEELIEVRPPEGSTTRYPTPTLDWSRQWPCEEIWRARKAA
ncbi:MAG: class I SAM-dependent methyltransferase [Solirubrobacteraceae bacterium]